MTNTIKNMAQLTKKRTYVYMNDTLKKQLDDLITDDFMSDAIKHDMTPIMEEIYHWGFFNISNKELKRIIKLYKKT